MSLRDRLLIRVARVDGGRRLLEDEDRRVLAGRILLEELARAGGQLAAQIGSASGLHEPVETDDRHPQCLRGRFAGEPAGGVLERLASLEQTAELIQAPGHQVAALGGGRR